MGEIHHFVPKAHLKATDNLNAFVEGCRNQLTVFGGGLDFDSDVWDITKASNRRGSSKAERISMRTAYGLFALHRTCLRQRQRPHD